MERLEKAMSKVKENSQQIGRLGEAVSTFKKQSRQIEKLEEDVSKVKEQLQQTVRTHPLQGHPGTVFKRPQKQVQQGFHVDIAVSRIVFCK